MIVDSSVSSTPIETLARIGRGEPITWTSAIHEPLVALAQAHGVEGLIAARLRDDADAPPVLRDAFAMLETAAVAAAVVRDRELQRVVTGLGWRRLDVLIVKGAALAQTVYTAPHLRPRVDADLLVRHDSLPRVSCALGELGYRPSARVSTGELVSHQRAFEHEAAGVSHVLDVHWRLANPQVFAAGFDVEAAFGSAVPLPPLGPHARTLAAPEALLLAAIHRLAHHQEHERLVWLVDIDLLARRATADEWNEVVELARARRVRAVLADGLRRARDLLGTPVPVSVEARLETSGTTDEPSAVYVTTPQRKLQVLRSDLLALPGWAARLQLLKEHAFPAPEFVMDRYGITQRSWLPVLYAHRLATGIWKWLRAR
jgi:hypothetical protein